MSASVPIGAVRKMLDACAPGYTIVLKTHNYHVTFNKLVFPSLPKYKNIEAGHVRKMARLFGILDCAKNVLGI